MIYLYASFLAVLLIFIASAFKTPSGLVTINNGKAYFHLKYVIFGIFTALSFTILTGLSAFRYYVGTDYASYANRVVTDVVFGDSNQKEFLFTKIVKIAINLGSTQWIFVISSIITMFFLYKYIIDQSSNLSLSVFLIVGTTFYNFSLNAIRQAMATAIFLYATKFIIKKKLFPYIFWIFVAIGFHKMAIIYFPVYLLGNVRIKKTSTIVSVSLLAFVLFALRGIIRTTLMLILTKIPMLSQYTSYFGSAFDSTLKYISLAFLVLNILVTAFIVRCNGESKFSKATELAIWMQLIVTVFSGISFTIPAAFRVFYILIPVQIVLIPNLINTINNRTERWAYIIAFTIIYLALFWFFIIYANYNETLPYSYVLNF